MLSEENLGYNVETFNEDDLVLIGSGGFAKVYKDKSNGLVLKEVKKKILLLMKAFVVDLNVNLQ